MRKILFPLAVSVSILILLIMSSYAVMDISARGRISSAREIYIDRARPSGALSRSLAHYTMGIIYDNEKKYESAIREFREAESSEPDISYLHTRLAIDYILTNKEKEALEEANKAKALDPDPQSVWGLSSLADLLVLQQKMNEAAAIYEKLIANREDSGILYFNLAIIYSRMGKADAAIEKLQSAVKINPDYKEAYAGLGILYGYEKRYAEAVKNFEKVLEFDDANAVIYFYLGILYEKQKKKDLAVKNFKEAIRCDPDFAESYNYLGYMFAESGANLDEAMGLIRRALEIEPDNGAYLDSLGWVYFKKGMYKEALVEIEKAVKLEPDEPEIKGHLETVRKKMKR